VIDEQAEAGWDARFAPDEQQDKLDRFADRTMAEHSIGRTRVLWHITRLSTFSTATTDYLS